jgi:hypothetical protein
MNVPIAVSQVPWIWNSTPVKTIYSIKHIDPELGAKEYSLPVGCTAQGVEIENLMCSRHDQEGVKRGIGRTTVVDILDDFKLRMKFVLAIVVVQNDNIHCEVLQNLDTKIIG